MQTTFPNLEKSQTNKWLKVKLYKAMGNVDAIDSNRKLYSKISFSIC